MSYAAQLFDQMSEPNSFVWNTLIRGFQQNHSPKYTLYYFDQMRVNNVQPDRFTYPFTIRACSGLLEFAKGVSLHGQVVKIGVNFDVFVGTSLVDFYTAMGDLNMTKRVFEELPDKDEVTWYAMLSSYVNKFNDMGKARDLFEKIPCKDLVSWNTVIGGLVRDGRINEAMRFFYEMERVNLSPDDVTLTSLLSACAQAGALEIGKWLHSYIDRRCSELNAVIGTALVDMYCKCGDLGSAVDVFNKMSERDVVAWSAMIMGSSMNGQSRTALNFFYRMKDESERPNDATILGVLCACVHAGLVDEGKKCFYGMSEEFGLTPKLEHYGCMVDLLGRAGLLDEAYSLIQSMPYAPHTGAWGALLGACKIHRNVELAEKAIEHLIQLDLEDGGYLAIMSNIYANAGRWEDVSKVRKLMKEKGIGKSRGISSIEVNGVIHEFGVQEKKHLQAREIYDMIDEIYRRLKRAGHVASTREVFFDVEEEEKEKALFFHSEKMAVAFGLIATDKTTIIRVVKNLRICPDCHAAMKLISASFEREIVIRDRHRFHHFKNGVCSCRDYW
ncbi:hypothetical protein MTR67_045693 [Solanum verrucosum]|uniref:DYW domain-containing protein n=1 Tax=Solanum verrucosum TaxID=315347 RepID=A0AAF0ZWG6_SOLVR|nr:hypothetical protein MTR67_045693 [Solanum verrucosum]